MLKGRRKRTYCADLCPEAKVLGRTLVLEGGLHVIAIAAAPALLVLRLAGEAVVRQARAAAGVVYEGLLRVLGKGARRQLWTAQYNGRLSVAVLGSSKLLKAHEQIQMTTGSPCRTVQCQAIRANHRSQATLLQKQQQSV